MYGILFAALGGFIAVRVSRSHSLRHVAAVAVLIAAGAIVSVLTAPGADAKWSQLSALLLMAPAALAGGRCYTLIGLDLSGKRRDPAG